MLIPMPNVMRRARRNYFKNAIYEPPQAIATFSTFSLKFFSDDSTVCMLYFRIINKRIHVDSINIYCKVFSSTTS